MTRAISPIAATASRVGKEHSSDCWIPGHDDDRGSPGGGERAHPGSLRTVRARPNGVTLIAVAKTFPADAVAAAVDAGATDIGENRAQELKEKAAVIGRAARWHFIGHLQSNKVRHVVGVATLIHSVDRFGVAEAIARRARALGLTSGCAHRGEHRRRGLEDGGRTAPSGAPGRAGRGARRCAGAGADGDAAPGRRPRSGAALLPSAGDARKRCRRPDRRSRPSSRWG